MLRINKKLLFILVFCIYPMWILGNQWVGILPLSNQRLNPAEDWLGYYFQARMQSFLQLNSEWRFHSPESLRLWHFKSKPRLTSPTPVNNFTTILIQGDFQKVLDLMSVSISITKFDLESGEVVTDIFQKDFLFDQLENEVDQFALKLAQWVSPEFKFLDRPDYPKHWQINHQNLMVLSSIMFAPQKIPETGLVLSLMKDQEILNDPKALSILSRAMLLLSQNVNEKDGRYFQNQIDKNLRTALRTHPKNSDLLALFAENMFFMNEDKALVNQVAKSAILSDDNNELAYLIFSLSESRENTDRTEALQYMKEINPWIWPEATSDAIQFQKGILTSKLLSFF